MIAKVSIPSTSLDSQPSGSDTQLESGTMPCSRATILVVDDNQAIAEGYGNVLSAAGFWTRAVSSARGALELIRNGGAFHAIITDVVMPEMDGLALLTEIRKHDLDLPVILVTGHPSLETAVSAIESGGVRYLRKPVDSSVLVEAACDAVALYRLARLKREALTLVVSHEKELGARANLQVLFERALEQLWIAFQPIVDWKARALFGYEALVRSSEVTCATPALLLDAAERLGRVWDLSRRIRRLVAGQVQDAPDGVLLFVNLHALDLEDTDLVDPSADLSRYADRVVLELTERNSIEDVLDVSARLKVLRMLGYRVAVDDLGAGYAGLSCLSRLEPDIAKLDMSLIHGINASARMQILVRCMLNVCNHELGIRVVCEGVETRSQCDVLDSLGADLIQGNLFGVPAAGFRQVRFQ